MMNKIDKPKGVNLCSFCLEYFTHYEIWWVDLKMHSNDPSCNSYYSVPCCKKCKEDPENSSTIVKVSQDPKVKKERKKKQ